MEVMGIVGWSGSGKTSLLVALLPILKERGLKVSTMKHAHHRFDLDHPGKDSFRHRQAGASEVLVVTSSRWVLLHESREEAEPAIEELIERMTPVDLLLIDSARWYRDESHEVPAAGPNGVTSISAALGARAAAVKQVREVIIMDANGDPLFRSRGTANLNHNASDRSYFIAQRDHPDAGLFISEPLTTRSEGRPAKEKDHRHAERVRRGGARAL